MNPKAFKGFFYTHGGDLYHAPCFSYSRVGINCWICKKCYKKIYPREVQRLITFIQMTRPGFFYHDVPSSKPIL